MKYETGFSFYGQRVGVLVFSNITPRTPGDAGNALTFDYPVRYEIVEGEFSQLINGGESIKNNLLKACINLKNSGVKTIVGDCGLMSIYQNLLPSTTGLLVGASSLCQIPLIWELIGREGTIGILTGHSDFLSITHLFNSGWREDIKISIQGLQSEPHFSEIVINGGLNLDVDLMQNDILNGTEKLISRTPDIKAIIFECSNIATFSKVAYEKFKIPIFDVVGLANILEYSINPKNYLK